MIKTEYKKVVKEVEEKDFEICKCDICNSAIYDTSKDNKSSSNQDTYYHTKTYHHEWGNDSIDSIEIKDICSDKCLLDYINNFYLNCKKSKISQELEIERRSII